MLLCYVWGVRVQKMSHRGFFVFLGPLAFCNGLIMKCDPLGPTVLPERPLTVLAEAGPHDVSWGKVPFIAASTGDDHAPQSNARLLAQECADNLCKEEEGTTLPINTRKRP